ncbi:hypothetical protein DSL72_003656 [Monilinia vaccinii-corymbosi]|uniref:Major facilitator superfamily (MFS) profile domain-containing protein n=1 Tax=Monilinia vaccinii-corymbosi TaxID=61207 RepID=A0A8A3NTX1_9HELO|nr:hypothetical protein DSL72_003656 [Monilinia vaccinii-corymbosi]
MTLSDMSRASNSVDEEKELTGYYEKASPSPNLPPNSDAHLSEEEKAEIASPRVDRKLVRKLDWTLIPWLCVLYLLAFLDRSNIGNAKIDGLQEDLHHMSTGKYNAALSIFFISYALFEPITNVMLKRFRPSRLIPIIVIVWGMVMTLMGFVKNWSGLMAARWFLGLAEAGLFPGISYYLSCWYKRSEFGVRIAIFFSAAAVSGSFGGVLAAAILKMDGLGGLHGWAWIFILEGLATTLAGVASFWLIHDFPENARFLSEVDRNRVMRRLQTDQQSVGHEKFGAQFIWQAVQDYKMWLAMFVYMGAAMPVYAFSLFLPTIIIQLGYTETRAQLLSVPPYVAAAILTVTIGFIADRTRQRGLCNIFASLISIAGFSMLLGSEEPAIKYAATFLAASGIYPCVANTISWISNNVEGSYKRGLVLGFMIGWGNLTGVISSNIYFDKPRFITGHATVIAFLVICLLGGSILLYLLLKRENSKRIRGERDVWVQGLNESEKTALGDQRPDFLYTL